MEVERIYKPSNKMFLSFVFWTGFIFFLLYAINFLSSDQAIIFSVFLFIVEAAVWFVWVRPTFQVMLTKTEITGPSPKLKSTTIPREQINRMRLHNQTAEAKKWGYRDVISRDRVCIRVWIHALGQSQVHRLIHRIKKA